MTGLYYSIGTILLVLGAWIGLSLENTLVFPISLKSFGGWIAGLLPVVLGAAGTICMFEGHESVLKHKKSDPSQ